MTTTKKNKPFATTTCTGKDPNTIRITPFKKRDFFPKDMQVVVKDCTVYGFMFGNLQNIGTIKPGFKKQYQDRQEIIFRLQS